MDAKVPPAMTTHGMQESKTNDRSQPLMKAMMKPPKKAEVSCINLPTFSLIASWMRMVSPDIRPMTSPVEVSVSKKAMSCLSMVFKYKPRILVACLSPVTIQHDTSV